MGSIAGAYGGRVVAQLQVQASFRLGCGTLRLASRKPVGTGAVWVNCGSDATESIKYKLLPLSWQGLSGVAGAANLLQKPEGERARLEVANPLSRPRKLTARNCRGPNAEAPKGFQRLESRNEAFGITKHETPVSKAEDCAEGFVGRGDFNLLGRAKIYWEFPFATETKSGRPSGSSSWLPRVIVDCAVPGRMFFAHQRPPSAEDLERSWGVQEYGRL